MPNFKEYDLAYEDGNKTLHYISAGPEDGDLIIFMHGWPGIGKTWHSQLMAFASKGYKVVAPDMPGYGGSSSRKIKSDYAQEKIVGAMLALLNHLDRKQAIWIAHDWGCGTLWTLARVYPEVCRAVCGMTVPYATIEFGVEEVMKYVNRELYPEDEYPWGQWSYMAFYQQDFDKATEWFDKDIHGFLKAGMMKSGPDVLGKPSVLSTVVRDGGWFGGIEKPPSADQIPDGLSIIDQETFEEFVSAMKKTGFYGPDAWYVNFEANRAWVLEHTEIEHHLSMPVLFIEAQYDTVCDTFNSSLGEPQKKLCDDFTFVSIESGHFVPLEKPEEVNSAIAEWLEKRVINE